MGSNQSWVTKELLSSEILDDRILGTIIDMKANGASKEAIAALLHLDYLQEGEDRAAEIMGTTAEQYRQLAYDGLRKIYQQLYGNF